MSVNDRELGGNKGVDTYPGVANPTIHNGVNDPMALNFVNDPTTEDTGAGAGPNFEGHKQAQRNFAQTSGVVEGKPGIIESANIDPLNENSNKDDGWANATREPGASSGVTGASSGVAESATGYASQAASVATGAAKFAYGHATGNEEVKRQGSEAVWGSEQ
ncbi:hypothetical protein PENSPDRAFT_664963 [Peniophora sp. CONT]|nr:hypothetical protein PENSPDRAFT_664963 [Peniophora sp. CONT]